jgi:hypothetical protein
LRGSVFKGAGVEWNDNGRNVVLQTTGEPAADSRKEIAMAWIRTIPPKGATGQLKEIYDAAVQRAGRVFHIVSLQSLNPRVLEASMGLYTAVMMAPSSLTRAEREMLATVTSWANDCFY